MVSKLIDKPDSEFDFDFVTIGKISKVISNMSVTNTRGFDKVNSKIIYMILHMMSLYMTYFFNSMIQANKFPMVLKVMWLLPILKPEKKKIFE